MNIIKSIEKFVTINSGIIQSDRVAIIYDHKKPELASELFTYFKKFGIYAKLFKECDIVRNDVSWMISEFENFDSILSNTEVTLFHNEGINKLANRGVKVISLTGADISTFTGKAAEADFESIAPHAIKLRDLITTGRILRIETESGTKIEGNITNRIANAETGLNSFKNPSVFPDIEVNTSIVEFECNGTVYIDLSMTKFGKLKSPIYLAIENGKIVNFEGKQAIEIVTWMKSFNDENVFQVAEFGFGLNPNAEIVGNIIEDESKLGTAHIGFGNNIFMGGQNTAVTHFDMVFDRPKVSLDNQLIIDKTRIFI
jgi:leucyl aminopeptidase (aminopeptidase T)